MATPNNPSLMTDVVTSEVPSGGAAAAPSADSAATAAATTATAAAAAAAVASPPRPVNTSGDRKWALAHGHYSAQGIRPTMEDEVIMYDHIVLVPPAGVKLSGITPWISFYAVFDGHGGKKAAEYTKANLVPNVVAALEEGLPVEDALTKAFVKTDADFTNASGADTSGTTAVTILIEQTTGKVWCANVGDSRCILARKGTAKPLSFDHKADRPDELDRIRKAGGFVIHKRVMGELAISRAIGDKDFKAADFKLVIAEPEIKTDTIVDGDDFIVIACDGLYDVMTNEQITTYFAENMRPAPKQRAGSPAATDAANPLDIVCTQIVTRAIDELHTRDNVSAIIVKWKSPPAGAGGAAAATAAADGSTDSKSATAASSATAAAAAAATAAASATATAPATAPTATAAASTTPAATAAPVASAHPHPATS